MAAERPSGRGVPGPAEPGAGGGMRARLACAAARVPRAVETAVRGFARHRGPQLAAAISYHVLFSLVPLFTFLAAIAALVLRDPERRASLVRHLVERFPLSEQAGVDLERTLAHLATPASVIGILTILLVLWSASGMMAAIRVGLSAAFEGDASRPYFRSKLVDLLLVLGAASALVLSFAFAILANAVARWTEHVPGVLSSAAADVLGGILAFALTFAAFAALYHLAPPSRPPLRTVWFGAAVAAAGFEVVKLGFSYYLATIATWDLLYGSFGSVLAFLLVVYLQASVFLLGGELAAAWPGSAEPPAQPGGPLWPRIRGFLRGLFVRE